MLHKLHSYETRIAAQSKTPVFNGRLLVIDPGETCGIVYYRPTAEVTLAEFKFDSVGDFAEQLHKTMQFFVPTLIIVEDYRVYSWKAEDHAWNPLFTVRIIGAIEACAALLKTKIIFQTPQNAKGFAKDELLQQLDIYDLTKGKRHARDATRHLVFFLLANRERHPKGESQ